MLKQTIPPNQIMIVHDSDLAPETGSLKDHPGISIIPVPASRRRLGWTHAFEATLMSVPKTTDYFFIMHDDDLLGPKYVERMRQAAVERSATRVFSCSLETISENGQAISDQPFQFKNEEVRTTKAVVFWYLHRCIPFPACFYKNTQEVFQAKIDHSLKSFADGHFLAQVVGKGSALILSETLYQYRYHQAQTSFFVPQNLEKKFFYAMGELLDDRKAKKQYQIQLCQRDFQRSCDLAAKRNKMHPFFLWVRKYPWHRNLQVYLNPRNFIKLLKILRKKLSEKIKPTKIL